MSLIYKGEIVMQKEHFWVLQFFLCSCLFVCFPFLFACTWPWWEGKENIDMAHQIP